MECLAKKNKDVQELFLWNVDLKMTEVSCYLIAYEVNPFKCKKGKAKEPYPLKNVIGY